MPKTSLEKKEANSSRYFLLRSYGLCVECGRVKARSVCPPCRIKKTAYMKKFRDRRREQELCLTCGRPSGEFVHCESCRARRRKFPSRQGKNE